MVLVSMRGVEVDSPVAADIGAVAGRRWKFFNAVCFGYVRNALLCNVV
jgi:hypothetical protein